MNLEELVNDMLKFFWKDSILDCFISLDNILSFKIVWNFEECLSGFKGGFF